MKDLHFDVEIMRKTTCLPFNGFEAAFIKRYRGIDLQLLESILNDIRIQKDAKITINIRGVNY